MNRNNRQTNRCRLLALFVILAFAGVAGCGGGSGSVVAGLSALLIELGKKVEVNQKAAVKDQKLVLKDIVEVFENSFAVIKFADGTRVNLFYDDLNKRNARLELTDCQQQDITTIVCKLVSGVVSALVPPKRAAAARYEIEAAQTITAIKGTQVKIATDGSKDMIALKEGSVEITHKATSKKIVLQEGTQTVVTAEGFGPVTTYLAVGDSEIKFFSENPRELYRY